jgi:glycerol-3-phosphate dehydrogenase subunit B
MNERTRSAVDSTLPVIVIGGGFAGVAAAWAASRAGARVVSIHDVSGASSLYSGIADGEQPSAEARELGARLGLVIAEAPRAIATREGIVRASIGRARAVLDLESVAGGRVGVIDVGRDDFDAELLARSFEASDWAARTGTRFGVVRANVLASGSERRIGPYDLACVFDVEARQSALASALDTSVDAWVFGPWLGLETDAAARLSQKLGRPIGEVSSPPGGAAGARFENARRALLTELGVECVRARVDAVKGGASGELPFEVALEGDVKLAARAVVLALGGVLSGGIELASADAQPPRACRLSLDADVSLDLDGEVFDGVSSLAGMSFQTFGLGAIERVGVRADGEGRLRRGARLYAAGDVIASRPRTVLAALESGIRAGRSAALGRSEASAASFNFAR